MFDINTVVPEGFTAIYYRPPVEGDTFAYYDSSIGKLAIVLSSIDYSESNFQIIVEKNAFVPLHGDTYYFINAFFEVEYNIFSSSYSDKILIGASNFFETQELAEEAAESFKLAVAEVKSR